jgi:hypothetical protein
MHGEPDGENKSCFSFNIVLSSILISNRKSSTYDKWMNTIEMAGFIEKEDFRKVRGTHYEMGYFFFRILAFVGVAVFFRSTGGNLRLFQTPFYL